MTPDWVDQIAESIPENLPGILEAWPERITTESLQCLHDEVTRRVHANIDQAERVAQAVDWLAARLGDGETGTALRCQGHILYARGRHQEALGLYTRALRILEARGSEIEVGRTLLSGLLTLTLLGRYAEAWQWAERATTIFERHNDRLRLARLLINKGNILYRQDKYAEALDLYAVAAIQFRKIGQPRDVCAVLSNLATCSISLGRFDDAVEYYLQAREESSRNGLPLLVGTADYNIAYLHYLRGDYFDAIDLYHLSREQSILHGDEYHAALCDLDEAELSLELNLNREAGRLAIRSCEGFERLGMRYEQAKAIVSMAIVASRRGDTFQAQQHFRRARHLFQCENNPVWPALIDLYRATLCHQQRRLVQASRLCRRAYDILVHSPLVNKAILCQLLRAQLLLDGDDPVGAREVCLEARQAAMSIGSPFIKVHTDLLLGRAHELCGDFDQARAVWQATCLEVEDIRGRLWTEDLKISFLKDKLAVYENLVALALREPGSPAEAFDYIQRSKSRSLADRMGLPSRRTHSNRREDQLRRDLNWHYHQAERAALSGTQPSEVQRLYEKVRALENALIEQSCPEPLNGPPPQDRETLQAAVPANSVVLEFYEVRGVYYVCLITRKSIQFVPLTDASTIRHEMRLLEFQLSKFRLGKNYVEMMRKPMLRAASDHLFNLYEALISPIRPYLKADHLIVAPHGPLHQLPFHALHNGQRALLDDFSVSYVPSAGIYALTKNRINRNENRSLVIGIPDPQTPDLESEVRSVAALLPNTRILIGQEATDSVLLEESPRCRFVHIASHGMFRQDAPMFSAIRLGNGNLNLFDLYRMNFAAELVTLSGCGTGMNAVVGGDELLGLMRGLLFAGAESLVVGLWDVNDQAASRLMSAFYGGLATGLNKPSALRNAMLEVRDEYPHPYYWAPFILTGNEGF